MTNHVEGRIAILVCADPQARSDELLEVFVENLDAVGDALWCHSHKLMFLTSWFSVKSLGSKAAGSKSEPFPDFSAERGDKSYFHGGPSQPSESATIAENAYCRLVISRAAGRRERM